MDGSGTVVRTAKLTGPVAQVTAADLDGDGAKEILAASDRELVAFEVEGQ